MKSIKMQMLVYFGLPILILSLVLGGSLFFKARDTVVQLTEEMSQEIVRTSSSEITALINGYLNEIASMTQNENIKSGDMKLIKRELDRRAKVLNKDFEILFFANKNGDFYTTLKAQGNVGSRGYFKEIMGKDKKFVVSDPIVSKSTGKNIFVIAHEVRNDRNEKVGIFAATIMLDTLSGISGDIKIGESGYGWIIGSDGLIVAHPHKEVIMKLNVLESDKAGYKGLVEAGNKIIAGESGIGKITTPDDIKASIIYQPIKNTSGWALGVTVPESDLMSKASVLINTSVILIVAILLILLVLVIIVSNIITKPLVSIVGCLRTFGNADFTVTIPQKLINRKDEIGHIADSMKTMQEFLSELMEKVSDATRVILDYCNNLANSSEQINTSSIEIARTIEEIATGANEQAENTEVGSLKAFELGKSIEKDQGYMKDLNVLSEKMKVLSDDGLNIMNILGETTRQTNEASNKINEIILRTNESSESIDEASNIIASIAKKTNLLALNAAIEAARAGEYGRGFAVVAEEIKNLALQSTMSTEKINEKVKELQFNSNNAVSTMGSISTMIDEQEKSVELTNKNYKEIIEAIEKSQEAIDRLNISGREMEVNKEEIISNIRNLAAIAQQNAAGTEEASAATEEQTASINQIVGRIEELKGLAGNLENTVSKFKF
ncbi:methyl-accepting chemotaxis protein [Wukongibacter baidiensis]|uniref:methyl-accepting chemotaxis protein n=1 Tax=Wukongibacter baidiensis TaxID=1723361 RepID=UPI003D7F6B09